MKSSNGEKTAENDKAILTAQYLLNSIQETKNLLPQSDINDLFFKRYSIPPNLQQPFKEMYEKLRVDLKQVRLTFVFMESVRYFLVNRYFELPEDTSTNIDGTVTLLNASNSVYIAFSLLSEKLPDWGSIGNPSYVKTLARSFGTSERAIIDGIYTLLRNEPFAIYEIVARSIDVNVCESQSREPEFMFSNVVVPFLMYISRALPLQDSLENRVYKTFSLIFSIDTSVNELKDFVIAFKKYTLGNSLHVKYINCLNNAIGRYNCRLYIDKQTAIGYHISNERIPINRLSIGSVLFLKKINFCLSMPHIGLSTTNENDVVLSFDDISEYADDISFSIANNKPVISFSNSYAGIWNELGLGFTTDSANKMCATLLKQEFKGLTKDQIIQKLVHQTALHEVKHKWDEATKSDKDWYTLECEISAHFTEAIYGPIPLYSLCSQLSRFQKSYTTSSNSSIRNKLEPLLRELWMDVQKLSTSKLSVATFRKEMITRYASFSTSSSGSLPPLEKFNDEIIIPCFTHLQDFSSESSVE
jgi:hypothetical protein